MTKGICIAGVLLLICGAGWVQAGEKNTNQATGPDLMQAAQDWVDENIDTDWLSSLPEAAGKAVNDFFDGVRERFQGEYVIDLASLKPAAQAVLPLLQSREELKPYAAWLSAQLDYFEVADEIRILEIAPPEKGTNASPTVRTNVTAGFEREIWVRRLSNRALPPGASNYVKELKPIFAAQKTPPELVWIAEVESSFDRRARSPMGAAGMFQLMPETAKRFGLSLWPRDERFQTEASASASAQYLNVLHERFRDWRLALAAYNCGEGAVQKLLERYKARSYDEIAGHLPAETQMFVPRVEAAVLRREGVKVEMLR